MAAPILIDASSPTPVQATAANPYKITTASFTPPSMCMLLALTIADANSGALTETCTLTDSLSGTWNLGKRQNGGIGATSEVWWSPVFSGGTAMTATSTSNQAVHAGSGIRLSIYVLTNCRLDIVGGSGGANALTCTVTAQATGSWIWSVQETSGQTLTPSAGCTVADSTLVLGGSSGAFTEKRTAQDGVAGASKTMGGTVPTTAVNIAALEVLPLDTDWYIPDISSNAVSRSYTW